MKSENVFLSVSFMISLCLVAASLMVWQGAGVLYVVGGLAIEYVAIALLHRKIGRRVDTLLLLTAATVSMCLVVLNINYFTIAAGGTGSHPVLLNFDASRDWSWACHHLYGDAEPVDHQWCLHEYLFVALLWLFGRDITVLIVFCSLCYVASIAMMGAIGRRLTGDSRVGTATMVIALLMFYLMSQSAVLIKDCIVTMLMSVVMYVAIRWKQKETATLPTAIILAVALMFLGLVRTNFMLFVIMGLFMMSMVSTPQVRKAFYITVGACLAAYFLFRFEQTSWSGKLGLSNYLNADSGTYLLTSSVASRAFENVIGDYGWLPIYKKILLLPLTIGLQFLLPLPWGMERHIIFGPSQCLAHIGFAWYIAGALILYWLFKCFKRCNREMQVTVLFGVLMTVLTAYMTSGRISRYCLTYLPLLLPAAAWVCVNCYRERSLRLWLIVFIVLIALALGTCYYLQSIV